MGWTGVPAIPGATNIELLRRYSSLYVGNKWTNGNTREVEVEALAQGSGAVYGILKQTDLPTGEVARLALVVLTRRSRGEFLFKELTETCGPNPCAMPKRLFERLSDPSTFASGDSLQWSREWRDRVVNHYASTSKNRFKVGDKLTFDNPVTFNLGGEDVGVTRFEVVEWGRRKRFRAYPDSGSTFLCRLSSFALGQPFRLDV